MPINGTAYDTTTGSGYAPGLAKVQNLLEAARVQGELQGQAPLYELTQNDLPPFGHPLVFSASGNVPHIAIDVRGAGAYDPVQKTFRVRNHLEYTLQRLRGELTATWLMVNPRIFRDLSLLPGAVYAQWVSGAIASRFKLDPHAQMRLAVLAAFFYQGLFTDEKAFDKNTQIPGVAMAIARATHVPVDTVLEIIEPLPLMQNMRDFCALAEEVSGSIALHDFNAGLLVTMLQGTWYGMSHLDREMVAVAIEHPPTFYTMIVASLQDRSFRKTRIYDIVESQARGNLGGDFLKATKRLIEETVGSQDGDRPVVQGVIRSR